MNPSASSRSLSVSSVSVGSTVKLCGSPASPGGLIWRMYHQPTRPATRITTIDEHEHRVGDPLDRAGLPAQALDGAGGLGVVPRVGAPVERVEVRRASRGRRCRATRRRRRASPAGRPARGPARRRSSRRRPVDRASSQACRMTAAATLSTTWRRAGAAHAGLGEHALGGHRGEPLVVGLDGHPHHGSQRRHLVPGSLAPPGRRRRTGSAASRRRRTRPPPRARARRCARGRGGGSGRAASTVSGEAMVPERVADGDADALGAEVEAERPHRQACAATATASAAMRRASSMPAGFLPPAVAMSPLPPPPPPTALAASRMSAAASMPSAGPHGGDEATPRRWSTRRRARRRRRRARCARRWRGRAGRPGRQAVDALDDGAVGRPSPASSPARPVASFDAQRLDLVGQGACSSSSLRCTPPSRSSPVAPTSRAASASTRSSRCSRATLPSPVTASMRRRLEPMEPSLTTLIVPMSPVARTWVPPHSSIDGAGLEDPHDVAVLVAEEGDGAHLLGLGLGRLEDRTSACWPASRRWRCARSRSICSGVTGVVVREVEAQPVGRDQRAGLLDVLAEHLAQGVVQQVGGGVVAAGGVAAGDVDRRRGVLAGG